MKKTLLLLLTLMCSVMTWAEDGDVVATIDLTKKSPSASAYATEYTVGDWKVMGANNSAGWAYFRIGGKSTGSGTIVNFDRTISGTVALSKDVKEIQIAHNGFGGKNAAAVAAFNLVSIDVEVADNKDFTNSVKTVFNSFDTFDNTGVNKGAGTEKLTPSTAWAKEKYYRIIFHCTMSNTNNCGLDVYTVKFIEKGDTQADPVDPTIKATNKTVGVDDIVDVSEMFTSNSTGAMTYSITGAPAGAVEDEDYMLDGSEFYATMAGVYTVTATQAAVTGKYNEGSQTATINVNQKYTVTLVTPSNGSFVVKNGEKNLSSGDKVVGGTVLDIVATAADGYVFSSWDVTNASTSEAITVTNNKFTMPAANVNVSATFTEIVYRTITWSVNGKTSTIDPLQVEDGANIIFPTDLADINGKKFVGWSANSAASSASDLVSGNVVASADVTYYAVFADLSGSSSLSKLGGSSTFSDGDNIAIFTKIGEEYYGMYQETISSSYVNYFKLDHEPVLADVSDDSKRIWTLQTASDGKWNLGDQTDGYLYNASSNNLTVDADGNKSDLTIKWDGNESAYTIKNGNRWIASRSDLSDNGGANQYKFRGGGTGSTPLGSGYFIIYRVENDFVYSNYTTRVANSYSLKTADDDFYTLYLDYPVTIPENMAAYTGVLDESNLTLTLTAVKGVIPAKTAVLVKSTEAGDYTFVETTADKFSGDNSLKGVTEKTEISALPDAAGKQVLTLGVAGGKVGFHKPNSTYVGANKAYLLVTPVDGQVKSVAISIDEDTTTGINSVANTTANGVAYNLAGQRVAANAKGIVIMNGKKFINK